MIQESLKIPKNLDRRYKLNDLQRIEIKQKYKTGNYSQRRLAKEYNVSRRLISFILDENKRKKSDEQLKIRRSDGRYKADKEKRANAVKNYRQYRRQLYINGKLTKT